MELEREFEQRKFSIQTKNYLNIINSLANFVTDYELSTSGLLLQPAEAYERAHNIFCIAKVNGVVDELNCKVE